MFFISVFIPIKVFLFPLTTDKYTKHLFIYSVMLYITAVFLCDNLLSSTYQAMVHCVTSLFCLAHIFYTGLS